MMVTQPWRAGITANALMLMHLHCPGAPALLRSAALYVCLICRRAGITAQCRPSRLSGWGLAYTLNPEA